MKLSRLFLLFILVSSSLSAFAQPYSEGRHTRHRFAQLTMGLEAGFFPSTGTTSFLEQDQLISTRIPAQLTPRIWIGGLHFWGHADFGVVFPVGGIRLNPSDELTTHYDPGVESIAKWYPWAITRDKVRPYLGFSAKPESYRQGTGEDQLQGPWGWKVSTPILAGVTYMRKNHLWEFGATYHPAASTIAYPISRLEVASTTLPRTMFSISWKYMLDTTIGAEESWESGRTEEITQKLGSRLDGWFVGIGPSSAWLTGPSSAQYGYPGLRTAMVEAVYADIVAGYYWFKPDLNLNLAFRTIQSTTESYGLTHQQSRKSLGLEFTKYLGDYHGFTPFTGPIASVEWLRSDFKEYERTIIKDRQIRFGLTAGWDIRPNKLQYFYLRTNLRWYPQLELANERFSPVRFHNLEVNFIQFVWMLGRR